VGHVLRTRGGNPVRDSGPAYGREAADPPALPARSATQHKRLPHERGALASLARSASPTGAKRRPL